MPQGVGSFPLGPSPTSDELPPRVESPVEEVPLPGKDHDDPVVAGDETPLPESLLVEGLPVPGRGLEGVSLPPTPARVPDGSRHELLTPRDPEGRGPRGTLTVLPFGPETQPLCLPVVDKYRVRRHARQTLRRSDALDGDSQK